MKTKKEDHIYMLFVVMGIQGLMKEADMFYQQFKAVIDDRAASYRKKLPTPLGTLYRGLIVDPKIAEKGFHKDNYDVSFISFSREVDVACMFAHTDGFMGAMMMQFKPGAKGYIAEYQPKKDEILFHHSWYYKLPFTQNLDNINRQLIANGIFTDLKQFVWNIKTQKEVMIYPTTETLHASPVEQYCKKSVQEIEKKYLWPDVYKDHYE